MAMSSDRRFCCPPDSWLKRLDASSPRWISVRRSKIAGFVSGGPVAQLVQRPPFADGRSAWEIGADHDVVGSKEIQRHAHRVG